MPWWTYLFWSLAALLALTAAAILYRSLLHDRPRGRRRCPRCWYDMAGLPGLRCPECGRAARRERSLARTRRQWRRAAVGALLAVLSYYTTRVPGTIQSGNWWALVPTPVLLIVVQFWDEQADQLFTTSSGTALSAPESLTGWERVLFARACARILAAPEPQPPQLDSNGLASAAGRSYSTQSMRRSQAMMILPSLGEEARTAVPAIKRLLSSPSAATRATAAHVLGQIADPSAVLPSLTRLLADPDRAVRLASLRALGELVQRSSSDGDPRLGPGPATGVARMFAMGVGSTQRPRPSPRELRRTVNSLLGALRHTDHGTRLDAARLLGEIGPPDAGLVSPLAASVRDPDLSTGPIGVAAIARFGPSAAPALVELLSDPRSTIRGAAASHIGQPGLPAPTAARPLMGVITDPDGAVQLSGYMALMRLGPAAHEVLPDLARIYRAGPDDQARLLTILAAGAAGRGSDLAIPLLIDALSDADERVRRAAADELRLLGPRAARAAGPLAALASDPIAGVRSAAEDALAALRAVDTVPPR